MFTVDNFQFDLCIQEFLLGNYCVNVFHSCWQRLRFQTTTDFQGLLHQQHFEPRVVNISLYFSVKNLLIRTTAADKHKKSRRGGTPIGIRPRRLTR